MNKKVLKEFCQSGLYYIVMEAAELVLENYKNVSYCKDPYELAYRHGEKEGARKFLDELKNYIENSAKQD